MYYFIGIKGTGMSALAVILKKLGYEVSGSDVDKHFFTEKGLIDNNISFNSYNKENIKKDYIIIKGASITEDNEELIRARQYNLEIIEYNEMVGKLTREFKTICVAGCHGKTTTTAMIAHVFNNICGINYLIGDGTGHASKANELFALESCEYKRHFLAYQPYYAIITNIDLDHVDYFKDINDVISAYEEYANSAKKMVIAYGDDKNVRKMKIDKDIIYFGLEKDNNVRAIDISYNKTGTSFKVVIDDINYGEYDLPIFGKHQLLDALAVIAVSYYENLDCTNVGKVFKSFGGAKRRFTETFVKNNIIIDDYAHHPNEVKATIDAIKQKYPDKYIISIFQPHTFTRTREFASDLANEFNKTNASFILEIHPAREKQEDYPNITSDIIINKLNDGYLLNKDNIDLLNKYDNAVFIFMSPNDVSYYENELIKMINNRDL